MSAQRLIVTQALVVVAKCVIQNDHRKTSKTNILQIIQTTLAKIRFQKKIFVRRTYTVF